jgi:hypothetical protein
LSILWRVFHWCCGSHFPSALLAFFSKSILATNGTPL